MQELDPKKIEYLDDYININSVKVAGDGPFSLIYCDDSTQLEKIYSDLKGKSQHFQVYKRNEIPDSFHYKKTSRVGDILVLAKAPYSIGTHSPKFKLDKGNHGYDPDTTTTMQGIFYAQGPELKQHFHIKTFRNIHIYPLIMKLLHLKIESSIDGDNRVIDQIVK
jgi:hypothetical protein